VNMHEWLEEKWYALELEVVRHMMNRLGTDCEYTSNFYDDLYLLNLEWLRGLDQDTLIEFVKQFDADLLKIVEA